MYRYSRAEVRLGRKRASEGVFLLAKISVEGHCFCTATYFCGLQPSFPAGQQGLDMKWRRVRPDSCYQSLQSSPEAISNGFTSVCLFANLTRHQIREWELQLQLNQNYHINKTAKLMKLLIT